MALTEDQKRDVEIFRAQGETDERIAAYFGVKTLPKGKATAEPKNEVKTEETGTPVTPDDLA